MMKLLVLSIESTQTKNGMPHFSSKAECSTLIRGVVSYQEKSDNEHSKCCEEHQSKFNMKSTIYSIYSPQNKYIQVVCSMVHI